MGKTIWTEEKKKQAFADILEHIISGKSLRSIIDNSDRNIIPSMPTFMEWLEEDKEMANQYARGMAVRQEFLFEEILTIADKQCEDIIETPDGQIINHNVIQRNRLQVDARKWMLGKMNPKKYGDKTDITSGGEKINTNISILNIDPLSDDATDNSTT